jgi:hypothetical protein
MSLIHADCANDISREARGMSDQTVRRIITKISDLVQVHSKKGSEWMEYNIPRRYYGNNTLDLQWAAKEIKLIMEEAGYVVKQIPDDDALLIIWGEKTKKEFLSPKKKDKIIYSKPINHSSHVEIPQFSSASNYSSIPKSVSSKNEVIINKSARYGTPTNTYLWNQKPLSHLFSNTNTNTRI